MGTYRSAARLAPAIALLSASGYAFAQVTPGQVGDSLKTPPALEPRAEAVPVQAAGSAPPSVAPGGRQITVEQFNFVGNTLFPAEELQSVVSGYRGHPVTLLELYEAADRVSDYYVRHGYTLASVSIPPQKITGDTVTLLVSEGRVGRITVENNQIYRPEQIGRYFPDQTGGGVYRGSEVEDSLRTLNTLPGLKARAILKPGETYGTSDLIVHLEEKAVEGSLNIDNFGRKDIGTMRVSALGQFNNPLKVEDQLTLLALRSADDLLRYGYAEYSLPLGFGGARLKGSYGHAAFDVRDSVVDGRNRAGRIAFDVPVIRRGSTLLSINAGGSRTNANADFTGVTFSSTKINLLEIGALLSHRYESLAVTQITTSIHTNFQRQGRDDLSPASGVVEHGHERLRWELDAQHLHPLPAKLQLLAHLNGVYSPDPLVDTEAYSLGGSASIRGYPVGEVRGDRGYSGSLTLRRPFGLDAFLLVPRVFVEAGSAFLVDAPPGFDDKESLTSTGIGTDLTWDRVTVRADWAFPLDNRETSDGHDTSRVFASLSVAF
jgi:hemolysin activation/secretion protein